MDRYEDNSFVISDCYRVCHFRALFKRAVHIGFPCHEDLFVGVGLNQLVSKREGNFKDNVFFINRRASVVGRKITDGSRIPSAVSRINYYRSDPEAGCVGFIQAGKCVFYCVDKPFRKNQSAFVVVRQGYVKKFPIVD